MHITFKEAKINYSLEGEGSVLVLLHGFLHDSSMWNLYKKRWLQENYQVLTIDLPGHGKSEVFKGISIKNMAEIVAAILDKESISKATIIGHSLGGYTGLAFAEEYPEKLDKLILFHSSAFADDEEVKKKRNLWLKIIDRHPALFVRNVISFLYAKENLERYSQYIEESIESAKKTGYIGYIEVIKAMRDRPNTLEVLNSEKKVYFLAGKLDKVIPEEVSLAQIKMIKNGRGAILENASHMGFIEDSENAFEVLNSFLQEN